MSERGGRWLTFGVGAVLASVFFIDLCDLLYGCGCRSLWAGAAAGCNIHAAQPPHCPWCEHPWAGGAVAYALALGAQALVALAPGRLAVPARLGLAVIALPLTLALVALAHGAWWSYWS